MTASHWPPDAGDPRVSQKFFAFRWDPDSLAGVSGQIFDLHCCLIFQKLSQTRGISCPIDLYSWHWELEIKKFCQSVIKILPRTEAAEDLIVEQQTMEPGEHLGSLDPEKRKKAHKLMRTVKGLSSEIAADVANLDFSKGSEALHKKEPWLKIGDYCPKPSVMYGYLDDSLNLRRYPALWYRLQQWWGWYGSSLPEPPPFHMRKIIEENIETLLEEQYIRGKGSDRCEEKKYELTSLGVDKLNHSIPSAGGTFRDLISRPDFISNSIQVITSVCQAVFAK